MNTRLNDKPISYRLRSSNQISKKNYRQTRIEQPKTLSTEMETKNSKLCQFCLTRRCKDYALGDLRYSKNVRFHKFCMYFSSKLNQNGNLLDNFWGFKHKDILKELKRCSTIRCYYCFKKGASINCCYKRCRVNFHLTCGIENGSIHYYYDENQQYRSFCDKHRPDIPEFNETITCTICQETAENANRDILSYVICCRSYFHRKCLAKLGFYQGELYVKCPNCNNFAEFVEHLKKNGFYLPRRGQFWDTSTSNSIERIINQCMATECKSEFGRAFAGIREWRLICCNSCRTNWTHIECGNSITGTYWICDHCS